MTSVYVIEAQGGPVKIGIAANPQSRLAALRTGTPFALRLAHVEDPGNLDAAMVEGETHAALISAWTHGEWFAVTAVEAREAVQSAVRRLRQRSEAPKLPEVARVSMTGHLLKAARALAGLDQKQLADQAGVNVNTIRNMEASGAARVRVRTDTLDVVEDAFKAVGVVFIDRNGAGPGVRLKDPNG